MIRVWGKIMAKGHVLRDAVVENDERTLSRRQRVGHCVKQMIMELDLPDPIWLPINEKDLAQFGRTSFTQDNFIENFPYGRFEVEIIGSDEDDEKRS